MNSAARRTFGAAEDLAARAVAVHINPRPWNISESRSLLRVLQQYGDVVFFRNLQHDYPAPAPNIFIAQFRTEAAAKKLLDASPLNYSLDPLVEDNSNVQMKDSESDIDVQESRFSNVDITETADSSRDPFAEPTVPIRKWISVPASKRTPFPFEERKVPSPPEGAPMREFNLRIDSLKMNLQDNAERQPYWNSFQIQRSMAQQDLAQSVPLVGLSDLTFRHSNLLEQRIKETNKVRARITLRQMWKMAQVKERA